MKRVSIFLTIALVFLLNGIPLAYAQTNLAETNWELVRVRAEGIEFSAEQIGMSMTFHFGADGRYTGTISTGNDEPESDDGTYMQSSTNVTLDPGTENEMQGTIIGNELHFEMEDDEVAMIFEMTSGPQPGGGQQQPPAQQPQQPQESTAQQPQQPQESPAQQPDQPQQSGGGQQQGGNSLAGTKWQVVAEIDANGRRTNVRGETLEFKEDGTVVSDHDEDGVNTFAYVQSGDTVVIAGVIEGKIEKNILTLYIESGRTEYRQAGGVRGAMLWLQRNWYMPTVFVVSFIIGTVIRKRHKATSKANTSAYPPPYPPASPSAYPLAAPSASLSDIPPASASMPETMPIQPQPVQPAAPHAYSLICTKGQYAGATFPINGCLSMGRDPQRCQLIFPNESKGISSLHCQVRQQGNSVTVTDMGSTYGTVVMGRKLNAHETAALNPGDSFQLADASNEFKLL